MGKTRAKPNASIGIPQYEKILEEWLDTYAPVCISSILGQLQPKTVTRSSIMRSASLCLALLSNGNAEGAINGFRMEAAWASILRNRPHLSGNFDFDQRSKLAFSLTEHVACALRFFRNYKKEEDQAMVAGVRMYQRTGYIRKQLSADDVIALRPIITALQEPRQPLNPAGENTLMLENVQSSSLSCPEDKKTALADGMKCVEPVELSADGWPTIFENSKVDEMMHQVVQLDEKDDAVMTDQWSDSVMSIFDPVRAKREIVPLVHPNYRARKTAILEKRDDKDWKVAAGLVAKPVEKSRATMSKPVVKTRAPRKTLDEIKDVAIDNVMISKTKDRVEIIGKISNERYHLCTFYQRQRPDFEQVGQAIFDWAKATSGCTRAMVLARKEETVRAR